tara:strand:- start:874 stop:1302 length:429 start_codon:yes stop_codon:yes gene_type:complete
MSEIFVDTIRKTGGSLGTDIRVKNTSVYESDGGTSVTQNLVQGIAKVWSNQTNGTANDSYNSSGITDNGTGDFSVNFSNAMSSANYSSTLGGSDANSNATVIVATNNNAGYATGSINYFVVSDDSGATDVGPTSCTVHGDLA